MANFKAAFTAAGRAARNGNCRAAVTYLGLGWRAYQKRHDSESKTGFQWAQLHKSLARMQTEVMTTCDIRNGPPRKMSLGRSRRR